MHEKPEACLCSFFTVPSFVTGAEISFCPRSQCVTQVSEPVLCHRKIFSNRPKEHYHHSSHLHHCLTPFVPLLLLPNQKPTRLLTWCGAAVTQSTDQSFMNVALCTDNALTYTAFLCLYSVQCHCVCVDVHKFTSNGNNFANASLLEIVDMLKQTNIGYKLKPSFSRTPQSHRWSVNIRCYSIQMCDGFGAI